jgi:FkbM family methyltransferase
MRTMTESLAQLKSAGFAPRTVIDVGVAHGTPPLYEAFPDAYFFLFEPVAEFEPAIQSVLKKLKGEYEICAMGANSDDAKIYVSPDAVGSSLMHRGIPADDPHLRNVAVRTLDEVFAGKAIEGPVLLKTDCQGGDLAVIEGGEAFIQRCDVIIMEVGMFCYWSRKTPDFADTVIAMKQRGFVPYDILDYMTRPLDGALGQVDVVFVKDDGHFRAVHKW